MGSVSAPIVVLLAALGLLSGCSSDDASPPATTDAVVATTTPTAPLSTTTAITGTTVPDAEAYEAAGLSADQAACVAASGVDGEFVASPGPSALDAIVLTSDDGRRVAVPSSVRTGADLEQVLLTSLAADCAPSPLLSAVAAAEGAAIDADAVDTDLPARLAQRASDGATDSERSCLDTAFRAWPARLGSLAADPGLVEAQCASPERLAAWRATALQRGLALASAAPVERACIVGSRVAQIELADAVDAVAAEDTSGVPDGADGDCLDRDRRLQLALAIVTGGVDFGAETLRPFR